MKKLILITLLGSFLGGAFGQTFIGTAHAGIGDAATRIADALDRIANSLEAAAKKEPAHVGSCDARPPGVVSAPAQSP